MAKKKNEPRSDQQQETMEFTLMETFRKINKQEKKTTLQLKLGVKNRLQFKCQLVLAAHENGLKRIWKPYPSSVGKHYGQLTMSALSAEKTGRDMYITHLPLDIGQPEGRIHK